MKITQVNNRYVVETDNNRLHILNHKSLVWNLKNVFKLQAMLVVGILDQLKNRGAVEVDTKLINKEAV